MEGLLHQIISGSAYGFIYASLALALVMIFQSTGHINFAQGEMAMFSTYVAWWLVVTGFPFWAAFGLAVASAFFMGFAVEKLVMRRFANAPPALIVIVFIGLLLIFSLRRVDFWLRDAAFSKSFSINMDHLVRFGSGTWNCRCYTRHVFSHVCLLSIYVAWIGYACLGTKSAFQPPRRH